jgi:myo-inositol catabolism protein IolC
MELGYGRPLFILPFDQRSSFEKNLFGFKPPLSPSQVAAVAASKRVIYEAFKLALSRGAPREPAAILVDEQFGASILRDARGLDFTTCMPVERSGGDEFMFEYGERWQEHIAAFEPTFVKVLARYNAEDDKALNDRQGRRLKQLFDFCHGSGRRLLFELLVPMNQAQADRLGGDAARYDRELRPRLMVAAIRELQQAGVEPDIWKIEGLDHRTDCEAVAGAARHGGRANVGCIVLGRGANETQVLAWLRTAAPVPGFIGFAVGRTSFWGALTGLRDRTMTHDDAVSRIADRYATWVRTFVSAREG